MTLNDAIDTIRAWAERSDEPLHVELIRCPDAIFQRIGGTENVWKLRIGVADALGRPLYGPSPMLSDPVTA